MKTANVDKEVKKFLKRVGAKKDDDYLTINNKVIDYITKMGRKLNLDCVYLLDRQLNDSDFMMRLLKANNNLVYLFSNFSDNLKHNEKFALEYLKIVLNMDKQQGAQYQCDKYLSKFKDLFSNIDFISKVIEALPNVNIIETINKVMVDNNKPNTKNNFYEIIKKLPLNLLCEQAKTFGCAVLFYVPKDMLHYDKVVSSAIGKDGFKALNYLSEDAVLRNKDLVIKAYRVSGIDELSYYLEFTLNPNKVRAYVENNKTYSVNEYDEKCAEVQQELLQSLEIKAIYSNMAGNLNWKVKSVKSRLDDFNKEEEDDEQEK